MRLRIQVGLFLSILMSSRLLFAVDMPGGLMQISDTLKKELYEFVLSPGYVMSPTGAYLSAGIRTQTNQDISAGLAMGAGEVGWHVGAHATWHILPDVDMQPAFGITGGLYLDRIETKGTLPVKASYFVVKVTPMISKSVKMSWGTLTPYSGLNMAPSFRLGEAQNEFSVKGSFGMMTALKNLSGIRLWTEVGIAVSNSQHEVIFGLSYPFSAI